MASNMTLYWISGSPPCWRVLVCLEEKKLQGYKSKLLSYEKQEHKGDELLKVNPRQQVPTFCDGKIAISESLAICEYLEDQYKSQGTILLPNDSAAKAKVLQRMHEVQNLVKTVFENYMSIYWFNNPQMNDKDLMAKKAESAKAELERWEKYLEQEGPGGYIAGKCFTLADVAIIPYFGLMQRSGLNMDNRPNIKAYCNLVLNRPSVLDSTPPHWKGTEGKPFLKDV